mmetsp:Transcript_70904/g.154037  ORF Transcript_70904/g.154037 Transcript_70904/m.154037 type:complete len:318 (+) Transcript_70904:117-1070(+)|eukprot:CAMPEP_0170615178 /NCGR_PEP_ID=MMETSP0224-20130122/25198_1 /TAXON_ID=285029 /ORGANISM="Togula jolla, Strain CCCM 725" /LENGTH=317 /DNA_ID=CAMNT_0010940891 /DNA_START=107 /DNA_END=1060 /DNA_ORIENTATION=+
MAVFVIGILVLLLVILVAAAAASFLALRRPDPLHELGVSSTYPRDSLPEDKISAYCEFKEQLRSQYAKDYKGEADLWMSSLPSDAKDMLKYRLMQRAIGDMAALQKIDADARGYWRLFSKGFITKKFWDSVMAAERELSQELENVRGEASNVEPGQDPQGIISEAMQFILRFGSKVPSPSELASADAMAELKKKLPGQAGFPGMGPGAMPPGPRPSAPVGPPPGQEVISDGYSWKQDADDVEVSVSVPNNAVKKDIKVLIQARSLKIGHCDSVLVEGTLAHPCRPEGSTWTLSRGHVVVSLEKAEAKPWQQLLAAKS